MGRPRDLNELIAKVTYQSPTEPRTDLSAMATINEIPHSRPPGEAGHEPDLTFHALADMAAEVDAMGEPAFLFEPVVVAGDYGVMSAEDKAWKTWGGLDAAVSAASGLPWMGKFPCHCPGTVLVFYGEGGRRKVVRRIRAIAMSKGL